MSFHTHITIADRGWILEKLASEIAVRSNLVSVSTVPDPSADLQYYINYSCRRRRVGPVEIAFFTHSERDEAARKRYFDIAADVEHSVCMSKRYADELGEAGIKDVTTITPGVDLDAFVPKVRIGVIGRTYHTGRKGESLVADVMDIPGIEWRFTGQGWPGKSTFVDGAKMPDFYNDLDYVLIPALYEGGPMSVLEGLACGVPIIASDVGWVDEYPHIPFENGNSQSLRAVLTRLVDERLKLRTSVEYRTWAAWRCASGTFRQGRAEARHHRRESQGRRQDRDRQGRAQAIGASDHPWRGRQDAWRTIRPRTSDGRGTGADRRRRQPVDRGIEHGEAVRYCPCVQLLAA